MAKTASAKGEAAAAAAKNGAESKRSSKVLTKKEYEKELERLQTELVRMQEWVIHSGMRVMVIFEGRDTAGKGGTIKRILERLNARHARVVALGTPTEKEKTQWYFQRYIEHLPSGGEIVLFDRSWYNRAGVEKVMGFCTDEQYEEFMRQCPVIERGLIRDGIDPDQVLAVAVGRGAGAPLPGPHRQPGEALEAQPDGPLRAGALGGLRRGEGRDVRLHRHPGEPLVRGERGRQEVGAAERDQPPAHRRSRTRSCRGRRSSCRRGSSGRMRGRRWMRRTGFR